ncbi:MAG: alpha-hydroxy acid oxidase [Pseudomonadales bacterium]|jgi:isopentenyl diphosphate isomerase/L-lactate dehydrogenase-like FMN-dependent dehydrogenase|nr:alpha-hydroxy acid oxidase [Pseudomonadales bacterium]
MGDRTGRTGVDRRTFLRWLAASPLLAALPARELAAAITDVAPTRLLEALVASAREALDVFDLQRVAQARMPPAHFGYIETGVDGERTRANNRAALERIQLRARRLVDVSELDTGVELFGRRWPTPLVIAPCGSQRGFHADGELATARAAAAREHLQVLSNVSSTAVEQVNAARGEPVWFQLYPPAAFADVRALVQRVEGAGCPVIVLTVDLNGGSNRLTLARWSRSDARDCGTCHAPGGLADPVKPMYRDLPAGGAIGGWSSLTWDFVARLREVVQGRLVLKGLVTREDAALALRHGVDGIWVSNHGGRAEPSGRATIDALPEVVEAVGGRVPVIVDSGFRRGADLFKGLALGADAVAVGRPYLWGLGAFGQEGVERALEILTDELAITMGAVGTPTVDHIGPASLAPG